MDRDEIEDGEGATEVVAGASGWPADVWLDGIRVTVWEDGTIGGIVLDGTTFDVCWDFGEVVSLEVLSADTEVVFWPEPLNTGIARVHDLWKNSLNSSQT